MSEHVYKPGDKARVYDAEGGPEVEILAGPVECQYWTRNKTTGTITTYYEGNLHPAPRVVFTEAQFDELKSVICPKGYDALMNEGSERLFFHRLRRDHSEKPEGETQ